MSKPESNAAFVAVERRRYCIEANSGRDQRHPRPYRREAAVRYWIRRKLEGVQAAGYTILPSPVITKTDTLGDMFIRNRYAFVLTMRVVRWLPEYGELPDIPEGVSVVELA